MKLNSYVAETDYLYVISQGNSNYEVFHNILHNSIYIELMSI